MQINTTRRLKNKAKNRTICGIVYTYLDRFSCLDCGPSENTTYIEVSRDCGKNFHR